MTRAAPTVHRATKEPGGSIRNYLKDYKHVQSYLIINFSCFNADLNGVYYTDPKGNGAWHGLIWGKWLGDRYSLKSSTMMIKRKKI